MLPSIQTVFFDAAGTLIHLRESVGDVYSKMAANHGFSAPPAALNTAFRASWKQSSPPIHPSGQPAADDDRGWWKALVGQTFTQVLGRSLGGAELDPLFEELYDHFAQPEAWLVFDDVRPVLDALKGRVRLIVLSNFDRRLRRILAGHDLAGYFDAMVISSEVGASKPHPRIFEVALSHAQAAPDQCLHVGDDPKADLAGAEAAGMQAYQVHRPASSLAAIPGIVFR